MKAPVVACELCGRQASLTFHHLIPRRVHRRLRFIKRYGKQEMHSRGLEICRLCHNGIHDLIPDELELAEKYNTKELLLTHAGVVKHIAWVAKQKS